jgi:chromosome segregation ATPase
MPQVFEEIRQQIHEIRNLINPFDLRLAHLDAQIAASRTLFVEQTTALETKLAANTFRINEHAGKIEDILENYDRLSERVLRLEKEIQLCPKTEPSKPSAAHADKSSPTIIPPQSSAL